MVKNFGEYFYTEIIPRIMEWQVIEARFQDPFWADAYRVKIAEDFFSTVGQLCISLQEVIQHGESVLSSLTSNRHVD